MPSMPRPKKTCNELFYQVLGESPEIKQKKTRKEKKLDEMVIQNWSLTRYRYK
jgi:hypothetical protein